MGGALDDERTGTRSVLCLTFDVGQAPKSLREPTTRKKSPRHRPKLLAVGEGLANVAGGHEAKI